jgi:large subunit ribosomal protein L15
MNLSSLKPAEGSVKKSKRIGRGQGSGKGGTSTRGHKGAKSRSGYSRKIGFEGGQMPLYRRVPKFGFKNINRVEYIGINIDVLNDLATAKNITSFDVDVLKQNGLISSKDKVKVLGRGELTSKIDVTVHAISASARKAIEDKGGVVTLLESKNNEENK